MPKRFYEDVDYAARRKELNGRKDHNEDPTRLDTDRPIPPTELPAAANIRSKYQLRKIYASSFTAKSDGELFLYVNDAIIAIPFWGKTFDGFYKNNTGRAKVTIKRLVAPPP